MTGTLTLNNTTFHIKAPSTSDNLAIADYVLCTAASIVGAPNVSVAFDVAPLNYAKFTITTNGAGTQVLLHYSAGTVLSAVGSVYPSSVVHGQSVMLTATVTPASGQPTISSVVVDASPIGAGSVSLVYSNTVTGVQIWTNSATVGGNTALGAVSTMSGTVTDGSSSAAPVSFSGLTVVTKLTGFNGAVDGNWSTTGNWTNYAPGLNDSVVFLSSSQTTPTMDNNYTVAGFTFVSTAPSYTIGTVSSTLTLSGGLTNNSANAQTLNVPISLNGSQTVNATSGNITLGNVVSGSGAALTKTGSGTVTLTSANTYSGATTISVGTLQLGDGSTVNGSVDGSSGITDNDNLAFANPADQTNAVVISGTGTLTKSGAGKLTLNVANTFTGNVTVNGGTVAAANGANTGLRTAGPLGNPSTAGRTVTINTNGTVSFTAGNVFESGAGTTVPALGFIVNQGGVLQTAANDANVFGNITLNGGTFTTGNGFSSSYQAAIMLATFTTGGSTASTINTTGSGNNGIMLGGAQSGTNTITFNVTNGTSLTVSAPLVDSAGSSSGKGALSKTGTGTLTLTAANNYSGGTTISAGTLQVGNYSSALLGSELGSGTVTLGASSTLQLASSGSSSVINYAPSFVLNDGTLASSDGLDHLGTGAGATITINGATTLQRQWGHVTSKYLALDGLLQGSAALTLQGYGGNSAEG